MPSEPRIVIVGAGIGGLAAAIHLAAAGRPVLVLERAAVPGGKVATAAVGGVAVDTGPAVLALRPVFEALFEAGGGSLAAELALDPLPVLGRHLWPDGRRLDLMADPAAAEEAIGDFAGPSAARGFRDFVARAARVYRALEGPFLTVQRPGMLALGARVGPALRGTSPFGTMWDALGEHFADPRLRQVFGRMAAYVGSSPLQAPATLLLVAHVEMSGLQVVRGGMVRLAQALAARAAACGADIRYGAPVAELLVRGGRIAGLRLADGQAVAAEQVVLNADPAGLPAGAFGRAAAAAVPALPASRRSFSAFGWAMAGRAEGPDLPRQAVFHPADAAAEYAALARGRMPAVPTVTLWAQGRLAPAAPPEGAEPLLALVAAPARGDTQKLDPAPPRAAMQAALAGAGVTLRAAAEVVATPQDHAARAPGTGGALYGAAVQGWQSIFHRPAARTALPGLFLAGGATHPGAGIAMAALSGRLAAAAVMGEKP
ncbi:phytoene desaturase family protein [Falsiroseomonas selenitidurans]|uniref:NAD(P)/FAD-dependent oxidoreductase n=1 Tax=Falsiroseomonas selenitidurans TaxID=2716335 RepID=A0ABX1E661_9PROT|nr:NAD(P)/FAD-dependent oxidoreductase [Falsiroseomonas selenitidurans]NKC32664.1 NAD(P)/FAD-dependent oxidoreductase [Falsiroseomonas selenitidurans]